MERKSGFYLVPWFCVSMPFATGPYTGSWGTVGRTMCPANWRLHRETDMAPVTYIIRGHQLRLARITMDDPAYHLVSSWKNSVCRRLIGWPRKLELGYGLYHEDGCGFGPPSVSSPLIINTYHIHEWVRLFPGTFWHHFFTFPSPLGPNYNSLWQVIEASYYYAVFPSLCQFG